VSGAPGAGKTTLSRILSEQLYIPHISSDLIHGGIALSNPEHNRRETLNNVFVPLLIDAAKRNINLIADHVLQKGISETDIINKLKPYAHIIYIHVEATDPLERYKARVSSSTTPSIVNRRQHLLHLADNHSKNLDKTSKPLDLGVPTLVVNTDDDYSPTVDDIVLFIKSNL
jgi:gluconate kinase